MRNNNKIRSTPGCCTQIALSQYQKGHVSLARAAEMAHVDQETFKELLQEAGIDRYIEPEGATFNYKVEQLMGLRNATS